MKDKSFEALIVRPHRDNDPLVQELSKAGCRVETLPVMAIEPASVEAPGIKQQILDIDRYQKIIVLSRHAAKLGLEWLDTYWPMPPESPEWYAVGDTTAAILKGRGIRVVTPEKSATSEGLLDLPQLQSVEHQKILLMRGQGGRRLLAETLASRGAQVESFELYRRVPDYRHAGRLCELIDTQAINIIVVHSGEILDCLLAVAGETCRAALQKLPLLVPSERVAMQAKEQGFAKVIQAKSALPKAMAAAII